MCQRSYLPNFFTPKTTGCVFEPTETLTPGDAHFSPASNVELKIAVKQLEEDCPTDVTSDTSTDTDTDTPSTTATEFSPQNKEELQLAIKECLDPATSGGCNAKYGPIGEWDVSHVTDMSAIFRGRKDFNADISKWDVSQVTTMGGMFYGAESFAADISNWDVSKVTDTSGMFFAAKAFNADISKWDVSQVTVMTGMFRGAKVFDADISNWDVSHVTDMGAMFHGAEVFNAGISKWDVSKVSDMSFMFNGAKSFNADISKWDVSKVLAMIGMFEGAIKFNADISKWDVSSVIDMSFMFRNAEMFKGDLSKWDVSNLKHILRIRGAVGGTEEKGRNGRLKWENLNQEVKNQQGVVGIRSPLGHSKVSFVPGPAGGILFSGNIIPYMSDGDGERFGFSKIRTVIDASTTFLGFSKDTKALRLEVTGDGQPYKVVVREKDKSFWGGTLPVWEAQFDTKAGERTVVELPLDKDTWHEMSKGERVNGERLPEWSKLQGIGMMIHSAEMHGNGDPYQKHFPFQMTVHSMELQG